MHMGNHGPHQIMTFCSHDCNVQRKTTDPCENICHPLLWRWSAPSIPSCMDIGFSSAFIVLLLGKNSSISTNSNSQIFWASLLDTVGRPSAGRKWDFAVTDLLLCLCLLSGTPDLLVVRPLCPQSAHHPSLPPSCHPKVYTCDYSSTRARRRYWCKLKQPLNR